MADILFLILFLSVFLLAAYIAVRFYLLKKALKETALELQGIQEDLSQNQILRLPLPDKDLETLMSAINSALDEMQKERKEYGKRERQFQSQIEAISHDLRTPLTVILGYLKLLQKQGPDNASPYTQEQTQMLDTIARKARAMERLIAEFYDYSRLNASDYKITLEDIDAGKILREVLAGNCLLLENAGLSVHTDFPDHPVWVNGAKDALERIFTNLLQNAAQYGEHYLEITLSQDQGQVQITFENDTRKISEKDIPYLFERFYMNDMSRNQGGSGLGLTIAKSLAGEMGGTLEARIIDKKDEQGKPIADGSVVIRFTLCLISCGKL